MARSTLQLLKDCREYILLDRESFADNITVHGEIPDHEDAASLDEVDQLLDRLDLEIQQQEAH